MIFIIIIIALIFSFILISRKYKNPYTLTFIFGKKGSGKSTLMVKFMLRYLKKGWIVYTDMEGVHIPGVRKFKTLDLDKFVPEENSVIFCDEGGITFDNRQFKNFSAGMRDFWKLQRHFKIRAYINSQSFDIDLKLRQLTDSMILQSNIGNIIGLSRPILRKVTLVEASAMGESRIADNLKFASIFSWRFTWLPRYHKYFESFTTPDREPIPFSEITGDLRDLRLSPKKALSKLKKPTTDNKSQT